MKALVLAHDAGLRQQLALRLGRDGLEVTATPSGHAAWLAWDAERPALAVLDLAAAGAWPLLAQGRRVTPRAGVLLLDAQATVASRIRALDAGADDCLACPADPDEVAARLRALARRLAPAPLPPPTLQWNAVQQSFSCAGRALVLTRREAALLRALADHPGQALARAELLHRVFADDAVRDDALEVVAHRLRGKLRGCGAQVVSVRGVGYQLRTA